MDFSQFEQQTRGDAGLSAFVQETAADVNRQGPMEKSDRFVVGIDDVLIAVVTYALFRWAKDYFDNKRAENETALAERQARITKQLIADGFPPDQALSATESLLKQIAKRTEDDPVLQKAVALIGTGGS